MFRCTAFAVFLALLVQNAVCLKLQRGVKEKIQKFSEPATDGIPVTKIKGFHGDPQGFKAKLNDWETGKVFGKDAEKTEKPNVEVNIPDFKQRKALFQSPQPATKQPAEYFQPLVRDADFAAKLAKFDDVPPPPSDHPVLERQMATSGDYSPDDVPPAPAGLPDFERENAWSGDYSGELSSPAPLERQYGVSEDDEDFAD
uniref:AGC-kinase C-terminal domain-containing protein n=1 Tax=Chromera velia CCMP2878 TaxID=1169474 RepID=A0A0G4HQL8_9ALVE|eukprot:Cvel_8001.t1-p1 / transcript=Cvel_8001.t1 / gene=Cvel_8001 / organism=Chromera_velia_CCMP2878 / gene_product=hypothetical protein / transcript_product=hypothetical protein / location=Cvel_scaffold431:35958-37298(-) / protein_length=199 / sequence_SO=supercontig / SO=protein_coding / is_pseudo=false